MGLLRPFYRIGGSLEEWVVAMEDWFVPLLSGWEEAASQYNSVTMNLVEEDHQYCILMSLTGYRREHISIDLLDGMLCVRGRQCSGCNLCCDDDDSCKDNLGCYVMHSEFVKQLRLPEGIEVDSVEANYEHGCLTICLPKQSKSMRHQVHIR